MTQTKEDQSKPKIILQSTSIDTEKIIKELSSRLIFTVNDAMREDMINILKYDFDPKSPNAQQALLRLFNYMVKTPEFQLV